MEKEELVIIPAPGAGHIVSTIEFAKRLLERDQRLSITVLVISHHFFKTSQTQQLSSVPDSNIRFIHLPQAENPPKELLKSGEKYLSVYIENHKSLVKESIINHVSSKSKPLLGLVIDMFCTSMIDVANELNVPSYVFFTSSAAFLGFVLYLPVHYSKFGTELSPSDPDLIISTFANTIPTNVLPSFAFNKDGGYETFLYHANRIKETKGIFTNTFAELESHTIKALARDIGTPPIYRIGPLLNLETQIHSAISQSSRQKILNWLNDQPNSSVIFLCFGSYGGFQRPQIAEIATALEKSGQRFLWSIRRPMAKDPHMTPEYTDFLEVLPEGFFERTKNRGLVCGWAQQVEILAHEAVGGFVSHCGWNSILESVWFGVPISTWPIYAEQQTNAFQLVKELELAVELRLDYRSENDDKIVMADEIEKAIMSLMDAENPVRKRVREMSKKSRNAVAEGGSSFISIGRLIEDMFANRI
ncbi:hypothetical protein M9H77_18818 [Catharanthus roseus]|uniref:Uncharacterized protein n=1 Tax=Catharanthus roseus TaxID=4058 RepID=A0ACC0B8N3_CATRO|nr:hypothetical protein M9H77_18818 [Catharanthus roseus]